MPADLILSVPYQNFFLAKVKKLTVLPQAENSLGIRLRQQCQLQRFVSYLHVLEATFFY